MQVLADLLLFDIEKLTWRTTEVTPFPRCSHSAVLVPACESLPRLPSSLILVHSQPLCTFSLALGCNGRCFWRTFSLQRLASLASFSGPSASLQSLNRLHRPRLCGAGAAGLGEPARPPSRGGEGPAAAAANGKDQQAGPSVVLAFGGYSGSAVEGNLLCLDPGGQSLLGPSCLPMTLPSLAAAA